MFEVWYSNISLTSRGLGIDQYRHKFSVVILGVLVQYNLGAFILISSYPFINPLMPYFSTLTASSRNKITRYISDVVKQFKMLRCS